MLELFSSFAPINFHWCWPRELKRSLSVRDEEMKRWKWIYGTSYIHFQNKINLRVNETNITWRVDPIRSQSQFLKSLSIITLQRTKTWKINASIAVLCVSFTWQMMKTRVIRLRGIKGRNARDQIAFCALHSFLVEVQTNAGRIHATHA